MDMIERVARSVYEKRNGSGCVPWGHRTKGHRDPYLADARAAIEAMREPTDAMIKAGEDDGGHSSYRWPAMIDAALSPKPEQ